MANYLFLGDYVDRGTHSLGEMKLKLKFQLNDFK